MPRDRLAGYDSGDDDDKKQAPGAKRFFEFDCPSCNAHNPYGDGFKNREEVMCNYCGVTFEARVSDEGALRLKEI
jgi:transcription elongation factor Elf1